jgi:hypothetical protein
MLSRELDVGLGSDKVAQWVVLQIKCQYGRKNLQVIWNYFLFIYLFRYLLQLSFAKTSLLGIEL